MESLPPICDADAIRRAYRPGLRIVWDGPGGRTVWEVLSTDAGTVTTRFVGPDGTSTDVTTPFEELAAHSAFPAGADVARGMAFETPAGRFVGTRVTVARDGTVERFWFSDDHPGPPIVIEGPTGVTRQVAREEPT